MGSFPSLVSFLPHLFMLACFFAFVLLFLPLACSLLYPQTCLPACLLHNSLVSPAVPRPPSSGVQQQRCVRLVRWFSGQANEGGE